MGASRAHMDAAIVAQRVRVRRGGAEVLRGIDLEVRTGSVTGLLGPSGCGKSTLMRAIVGVQANVEGEVRVLGLPAGSRGLRARVGYVTQSASVYRGLTVRENLRYFSRIYGVPAARVHEVIDLVDLGANTNSPVAQLSGGEVSRVSLAATLLGDPEVLVMDEPTVGLDPVLRRDLWAMFHRLAGEDGRTMLISSHVMDEAERCDDLLLMREGQLLAQLTPDELRACTGHANLEHAFLALVEGDMRAGDER